MMSPIPAMPIPDAAGLVGAASEAAATSDAAANGKEFAKVLEAVSSQGDGTGAEADAENTGGEPVTGEAAKAAAAEAQGMDAAGAAVQASVIAANLAVADAVTSQTTAIAESGSDSDSEGELAVVIAGDGDGLATPSAAVDVQTAQVATDVPGAQATATGVPGAQATATGVPGAQATAAGIAGAVDAATAPPLSGVPTSTTATSSTTGTGTTPTGAPIDVTTGQPVAAVTGERQTPQTGVPVASEQPVATAPIDTAIVADAHGEVTPLLIPVGETAPEAAAVLAADALVERPDTVVSQGESQVKTALEAMSSTVKADTAQTVNAARPATVQAPTSPEPYRQVADIVAPLRHRADGEYQMTLRLYPEHLGRVEVAVTLTNGQISMQLSSDNASARQMLRESLNELRSSLESSGLSAGSLDVGSRDAGQNGNGGRHAPGAPRATGWTDADSDNFFARLATVATPPSVSEGRLDARL